MGSSRKLIKRHRVGAKVVEILRSVSALLAAFMVRLVTRRQARAAELVLGGENATPA